MGRYSFGLVASALGALLALAATRGGPAAAQGWSAELTALTWTAGEETHLFAPRVEVDLDQRTASTSLTGMLGGAAVEIRTLELGQRETSFEHLRARGSLSARALEDLQVERLGVRRAEVLRLRGLSSSAAAPTVAAARTPGTLTLEIARGGLRLSVSGVGWLEHVQLVNGRGDSLSIDAVSIPMGDEWACDGVSLVEAGVARRFERLIFVARELTLVEPRTLGVLLAARPPPVVLDLRTWE